MRYIIALLLVLVSFSSNAYVMLGGWSSHLCDGEFNETHNFLAVEHENFMIGTFKNSFYKRSTLAGYIWHGNTEHIEYGAITGAVTGYGQYADVLPIAVPYVTLTHGPVKPVVGLLGEAVFISIRIDFN